MEYNTPIVAGIDGGNPIDVNSIGGVSTYGTQWVWESQYVAYVEFGIAYLVGAVIQIVWSQIDLTP